MKKDDIVCPLAILLQILVTHTDESVHANIQAVLTLLQIRKLASKKTFHTPEHCCGAGENLKPTPPYYM
jgi:hypothetical protein